jgi:hypothetical protein
VEVGLSVFIVTQKVEQINEPTLTPGASCASFWKQFPFNSQVHIGIALKVGQCQVIQYGCLRLPYIIRGRAAAFVCLVWTLNFLTSCRPPARSMAPRNIALYGRLWSRSLRPPCRRKCGPLWGLIILEGSVGPKYGSSGSRVMICFHQSCKETKLPPLAAVSVAEWRRSR